MTDDELIMMASQALTNLDSVTPMIQAWKVVTLVAPIIRDVERQRIADAIENEQSNWSVLAKVALEVAANIARNGGKDE